MKALSRLAQKKINMLVTIDVKKIGAQIEDEQDDVQLFIAWKRGKVQDESASFDLNHLENDIQTQF